MEFRRDYGAIAARVRRDGDRAARMRSVVDVSWEALHDACVSWIGFYVHEGGDELILACCRDKPACSPIGLHGAGGQSFREKRPLVVRDVRELGPSYIACDPRDQSELVIPLCDPQGKCWGVLDVDSYELAAFGESDVRGLTMVLEAAGLCGRHSTNRPSL